MSLNGLDDAAVKEAHDAAVAEPGGWFLLKYASRDEVGLLGRGSGGIVEIRDAIAQYDEASPLYGFLKYRRRNVIIKYLPENCSRLVQARVAVHFNAVCEWFAPYNTTFSISEAKELKDTKLSAACSLHTASSSTSSSTSSLRRRRLVEIAEEEEEELQRATKRQSVVKEEERAAAAGLSEASSPPVTLNAQLASLPDESQFAGTADPPSFTGLERPSSPSQSLDARRLSSQLTRPEMHSYASYTYGKPKVKLAPRPSLDVSGRPRTSAGAGTVRPVSSIPAGFKLFSKGSKRGRGNPKNGGSQIDEEDNESAGLTAEEIAAIPLPADPSETLDVVRPHTSGGRPTSSSGLSVKSLATTIAGGSKPDKISPEKARLMKAMKLREKKRKLDAQTAVAIPTVDVSEPRAEPEASDAAPAEDPSDEVSVAGASVAGSLDDRPGSSSGLSTNNTLASNIGYSDSAIDIGLSSSAADQASIDTQTTDSHPASPLVESSEIGDSTKASSLSESTDETVQALQDLKSESESDEHVDEAVDAEEAEPKTVNPEAAEPGNVPEAEVVTPEAVSSVETNKDEVETTPADEAVSPAPIKDNNVDAPKDVSAEESNEEEKPVESKTTQNSAMEAVPKSVPETPDASRPNTSTTSELSSELDAEARSETVTIPAILVQQRDSQSTIGLESTDPSSTEAKRARRRALVDPIRTDMEEDEAANDDGLVKGPQSATVQEAKSMLMSRSPVSSAFPGTSPTKSVRGDSDSDAKRIDRTVSNPTKGSFLVPGDAATSSARSASSGAAYLQKIAQQNASNLSSKKSNIGSSISQRIKALEKLSGSTPGPVVEAPVRVERPTSAFFSVRKPTVRDTSRSPSVVDRASSLTREKTPSPPDSRESTPEMPRVASRDRAGSMASRLSMFEGGNVPRGRPESVQVKARIIRDPTQPFPKLGDSHYDPSDPSQLDFKQSHLTVNHQKGTGLPGSVYAASASVQAATESGGLRRKESLRERRMSREKRRSQSQERSEVDEHEGTRPRRRSSLSIVKDFIKDRRGAAMTTRSPSTDNLGNALMSPASIANSSKSTSRPPSVHNSSGLGRRLSISSRRSTSKDRDMNTSPLATPMSPSEGNGSSDDCKSVNGDYGHKKTGSGGRASRFMRRLSSSLGSSNRKNGTPTISPTVAEEEEVYNAIPPSRGSIAVPQNPVSYIGDVNVQFPDNLLWKRRTMCLDSQGFLILSTGGATSAAASIVSERAAGTVKRYHLSDFRMPYIPEMELQELPNSVCLDFVEGSGLQVACEDRAGQMNILQILQEAHQSHSSFGQ